MPNEDEKIDLIEYRRVSVVLNYLKDKYQIDKSIFRIVFNDSIENEFFMRFSIREK